MRDALRLGMNDAEVVQRIAGAVTPAVMVSACGLLALGLDNQAARMTTRLRDLAREFRGDCGDARERALRDEVVVLSRRHGLYVAALLFNYGALLSFVLASASALWLRTELVLVTFGAGVLLLAGMAVCTLSSVRLSRRAIVLEEREVLRRSTLPPQRTYPSAAT